MIDEEFGKQFFLNFGSISLGIVGGAFASFLVQKRMKNGEKNETKKNMIKSIKKELDDAKEGVDEFNKNPIQWIEASVEFKGEKPWILKPAYDSAVNSGNFSLLDKDLQKDIPSAYLSIDAINFYSDLIRRFIFTTGGLKKPNILAGDLCIELAKNVKKLDEKLEKLLPKLNSS